jgi:hypothetical protein
MGAQESREQLRVNNLLKSKDIFIDEVSDDFVCTAICHCVLMKTSQCKEGHVFCEECIHNWLKTKNTCPVCIQPLTKETLSSNRTLDNIITRKQVRCANAGCRWTGIHSDFACHIKSHCGYEQVTCANAHKGCRGPVLRLEVEEGTHVCPAVCQTCKHVFPVDAMDQHKFICDMATVQCTNKPCTVQFLRQDRRLHEAECSHATVDCPFAMHGCTVGKLARSAMTQHQAAATSAHSLLVAEKLRQQEFGPQLLRVLGGEKVTVSGSHDGFDWEVDYDALKTERALKPTEIACSDSSNKITIPALPGYQFSGWACFSDQGLGLYLVVDDDNVKGGNLYPVKMENVSIICCDREREHIWIPQSEMDETGMVEMGKGWITYFTTAEADARAADGKLKVTINFRVSVEVDMLAALKASILSSNSA